MMLRTDMQIREDVLREIRREPRLAGTEITVSVNEYIVTLTGPVSSADQQLAAQEATRRVEDVFGVCNLTELLIPSTTRTDAEIAREVQQVLACDTLIPGASIDFAVSNGWVALEGHVDLLHDRANVERAVSRLAGVRGVYNNIMVDSHGINPENVAEAIEDELKQLAERKAAALTVALKGDTVTLSGRVQSWEEERAVVAAASHAPGVRAVEDRLAIDPFC